MAFFDYLWIIKLVIEILKLISNLEPEERVAIHNMREEIGEIFDSQKQPTQT